MWHRYIILKFLGALVLLMLQVVTPANAGAQADGGVLKQGSSGARVAELQERLNRWNVQTEAMQAPLPVTGYFGKQTEAAVRLFQRAQALPVSGIVDAETWAELLERVEPEALKHLWPRRLPRGMVIDRARSWHDGTAYELRFARTGAHPAGVSIYGGVEGEAPDLPGRRVWVRGLPAMAYSTPAGNSIEWREAGRSYAVVGDISVAELLVLANDLQALDRGSWLQNLARP